MNGGPFSDGERVRILTGKYTGLSGSVLDPAVDSELLPPPRPGYYWIKVVLHNFFIPVHVHESDIQRE
jgi:hypothetical protein